MSSCLYYKVSCKESINIHNINILLLQLQPHSNKVPHHLRTPRSIGLKSTMADRERTRANLRDQAIRLASPRVLSPTGDERYMKFQHDGFRQLKDDCDFFRRKLIKVYANLPRAYLKCFSRAQVMKAHQMQEAARVGGYFDSIYCLGGTTL